MDSHVLLKVCLQHHLATDPSAVTNIPYLISVLTPEALAPSVHTQKWTARISTLLHAKDSAAHWAGLVLALRTACLSRSLLLEHAQSWLGVTLPILSKSETASVLKAAVRLLAYILAAAQDVPEFQRQLATPNAPKVATALLGLAEKRDVELRALSMRTLAQLVTRYPTALKSLHAQLHALSFRRLNGSAPLPSDQVLLEAAAKLYSALPLTGGKVGAAAAWRKEVDETVAFAWAAFASLRTTFPAHGTPRGMQQKMSVEDPAVWVPLNSDRLRCAAVVLAELLRFAYSRPVTAPVGQLVKLVQAMLTCTSNGQIDGPIDPTVRVLEEAAVPTIWRVGNDILSSLASALRHHLTPYATRLLTTIAYHLEQPLTAAQRKGFFQSLIAILTHTHGVHHALLPTRLTKAVLSTVSVLLRVSADGSAKNATAGTGGGGRLKKGKKRARDFEGDEVFSLVGEVACPTRDAGDSLLFALDALRLLLRNAHVAPTTLSLATRILLSIHLSAPSLPASQLSSDAQLNADVFRKVQTICVELAGRSLPLVIRELNDEPGDDAERMLDLLVHPRAPPMVRSMPPVEALALFRDEEGSEERAAREMLGITTSEQWSVPSASVRSGADARATADHGALDHGASTSTVQERVPLPLPLFATGIAQPEAPQPVPTTVLVSRPAAMVVSETGAAPVVPAPSVSMPSSFSGPAPMDEDDDDEPMPTIDLESDTDED
ncbi:rRNA processing/ribosome biogenesis-domain-containing protein [Vararia minispora EC-137]|uniref:rRNA processing/ribosome biogenesis-domain-containing protein n=1 Tax=Vararia minispora EC-137 TaxID=1314806 RepID=A0ACB8QPA0_9AGAM|nr:rRNA processing/ribosome biogenesis-domain-containing protein [Vararia minispora EC-137]